MKIIPLDLPDIVYGLQLERQIAQLQAQLATAQNSLTLYMNYLGNKHGLTGEVTLNNWAKGFEVNDDGELHDQ